MRGELFRRLLRAGAHATFVQTSSVKEPGLASEAHSPSASRSPPNPGRSRFLRSAPALRAPGKQRFSPIPGGLSTLFLQIFPAGFPVPRRALRNPLAAGSRQTQREDHTSPKIKVKRKNPEFFREVRPADLQDGAKKRVQSPPHTTARIEAQQSGVALSPEEEPGCIVPPGTADNSPPFQRWDKPRSIIPPSPGGTAEALSEEAFQPSLPS